MSRRKKRRARTSPPPVSPRFCSFLPVPDRATRPFLPPPQAPSPSSGSWLKDAVSFIKKADEEAAAEDIKEKAKAF